MAGVVELIGEPGPDVNGEQVGTIRFERWLRRIARVQSSPVPSSSSSRGTPGAESNQSLARGLHMVQLLADHGPLTATELASRLGIHQSSASRSLGALMAGGYVRKDAHGKFECSFGILGLSDSLGRLPLVRRLRSGVEKVINDYADDITVAIYMLWQQHDVLHLLRARNTHFLWAGFRWGGGFPLNASASGLRLLIDLPDDQAIAILERSRDHLGWGGRPEVVPETAVGTVARARELLSDEVLLLDGWWRPGHASGAIVIRTPEPSPVSLAIVDETGGMGVAAHKLLLHRVRRDLESQVN